MPADDAHTTSVSSQLGKISYGDRSKSDERRAPGTGSIGVRADHSAGSSVSQLRSYDLWGSGRKRRINCRRRGQCLFGRRCRVAGCRNLRNEARVGISQRTGSRCGLMRLDLALICLETGDDERNAVGCATRLDGGVVGRKGARYVRNDKTGARGQVAIGWSNEQGDCKKERLKIFSSDGEISESGRGGFGR